MRKLTQFGLGILIFFTTLGVVFYAKGMHAARPITHLVTGRPILGSPRRLSVFVKGGSADLTSYQPLLSRLAKEPELAGSDLLIFDHQLGRLTIGHDYDFATRLTLIIASQLAPWVGRILTGATDRPTYRKLGIVTYGFDPFKVESADSQRGVHGNDERLSVENVGFGVHDLYDVLRYAQGAAATP